MSQVIIYKNDAGNIATVIPVQEYIDLIGIDAIAHKDVPAGTQYRVLVTDLPSRSVVRLH